MIYWAVGSAILLPFMAGQQTGLDTSACAPALPRTCMDRRPTVADERGGLDGAPGGQARQQHRESDDVRNVRSGLGTGAAASLTPWHHRGYLGWVRDLASVPAPAKAYWPYLAVDPTLVEDYDKAAAFIRVRGATEVELWGIAAGGSLNSPGYAPDVEKTVNAARHATIEQIIAKLHARGLKVIAGTGAMSWGFDRIVAANPSIACSNSPYLANPKHELAWSYQMRIIDYLMSFGVDGIAVQSGDQGICAEGNPNGLNAVQYAAPIVNRVAAYVRAKYPSAIMGSANYGVSFGNPADLPYVRQYARNLDYVVDVGDTAKKGGPGYRAQLAAAIVPAELGQEADPNPTAPVHFDRLSWFLPTFQHDVANLKSLYADGGRSAENYMRMLANPSDEISAALVFDYEAKPGSDVDANLDRELTDIYKPASAAALARLHEMFVSGETAYFSNANSENSLVETYYNYNDRGRPYLRDNMSASGRAAYRVALIALLAEARAVRPDVGNKARVDDIIACIQAVIAQLTTS